MLPVAEVAAQLRSPILVDQALQILSSQRDQRLFHALPAAAAMIPDGSPFQDLRLQAPEPVLRQLVQGSEGQLPADIRKHRAPQLQLRNHFLRASGQRLDQNAPRLQHQPLMNPHPKRHQTGLLLRHRKVVGKFVVTAVNEEISEGTYTKKGFYDTLNVGDELVLVQLKDAATSDGNAVTDTRAAAKGNGEPATAAAAKAEKDSIREDMKTPQRESSLITMIHSIN